MCCSQRPLSARASPNTQDLGIAPASFENSRVDFLLECVGFPPDHDLDALAQLVRERGEDIPWRGPAGEHKRLPLAGGLEVHLDREESGLVSLWPYFVSPHRLRVQVESLAGVPDSPYHAHLVGVANPPPPGLPPESSEGYRLSAYLTDRRRIPSALVPGHVLAVSVAGFALDIQAVGPNAGVRDQAILERPSGAALRPLGAADDPGGCMEVSLRVQEVRRVTNPITGIQVGILETDAPGRPLQLFVSEWQLEQDGLPAPRPGWRIEGAFLFTGRVSGGLPSQARRRRSFG